MNFDIFSYLHTKMRELNDKTGRILERAFIHAIISGCTDGPFKNKAYECISSLCPVKFDTLKVLHLGGRINRKDCSIQYFGEDGKIVHSEPAIELKTSNNKVFKSLFSLPQILELSAQCYDIIPGFSKFVWENHVKNLTDKYPDIPKINNKEYQIYIGGIQYNVHPFFESLKNKKVTDETFKKYLSYSGNTVITKFIAENKDKINIKLIHQNLLSQRGKVFILWSKSSETFSIGRLTDDDIQVESIDSIKSNGIILKSKSGMKYTITLRWANNIGILNPSWKFRLSR
jgi:hypothetical protein